MVDQVLSRLPQHDQAVLLQVATFADVLVEVLPQPFARAGLHEAHSGQLGVQGIVHAGDPSRDLIIHPAAQPGTDQVLQPHLERLRLLGAAPAQPNDLPLPALIEEQDSFLPAWIVAH